MLKHSVLPCFYTCWIHKRGSLTQFLPLKLVEPQSKCKQAHSHCSDGSAVLTFWLIAGFVRSVMRHFFPAQFGKKSFIWRWGSYKADTRALNHTGWLQREWLIPSLASYSMSTVMCWNYWSKGPDSPGWTETKKKSMVILPTGPHTKALTLILTFLTIQNLYPPAALHQHSCSHIQVSYSVKTKVQQVFSFEMRQIF